MTKQEFLEYGQLNFTVSKVRMHTYNTLHADDYAETPFFATVNDQTGQALGPVRKQYTVIQNEDLLNTILDKLEDGSYNLDESRCGSFAGGKKIYFFIKLNSYDVFGDDKIDKYLYALSSHDGSQKLVFGISTRMHSCANMFSILMSNKDNVHVIKHTKQVEQINTDKINEMINRNMSGLKKLYTKLIDASPSSELIEKTADIIASSKLKKIPRKTAERRKELMECIKMEMDNKGHTHFGLFNGVTNYLTHKYKTNWSADYEMLAGNSNKYSNKVLNLLVKDLIDKGISLN
tara:strand:- start:6529 stop:7401 length:873 start_codon:yes stop_codon:yes gene_type:complete